MIVFDLECRAGGHRFEGWFGSSDEFARQQQGGLLCCPQCGSTDVAKAVMAPNVAAKGNQRADTRVRARQASEEPTAVSNAPLPPEAQAMLRKIAEAQAEALKSSRWVGDKFAEDARAMHYGERDHEAIHGQATPEQAAELAEEGIPLAPILFPVAPPDRTN